MPNYRPALTWKGVIKPNCFLICSALSTQINQPKQYTVRTGVIFSHLSLCRTRHQPPHTSRSSVVFSEMYSTLLSLCSLVLLPCTSYRGRTRSQPAAEWPITNQGIPGIRLSDALDDDHQLIQLDGANTCIFEPNRDKMRYNVSVRRYYQLHDNDF